MKLYPMCRIVKILSFQEEEVAPRKVKFVLGDEVWSLVCFFWLVLCLAVSGLAFGVKVSSLGLCFFVFLWSFFPLVSFVLW